MKGYPVLLASLAVTAACLSLLLLPFPRPAWAGGPAGKVVAATGQVTAAGSNGEIRELIQDSPVFSGDIISTGPNSRVRINFSDNSIIALRPSTRFVIDDYRHAGDPKQDQSAFSLVRGGFRAVTGAIGHANHENYRIETPSATIGIRGTEHRGRFCAGDCFDLVEIGISAPPDGLYTGTSVGRTTVGGQEFGAGEYGFTNPAGITVRLPEPPPILMGDPHLQDITPGGQMSRSEEGSAPGAAGTEGQGEEPAQDAPAGETRTETDQTGGSGTGTPDKQTIPPAQAAPEAQQESAGRQTSPGGQGQSGSQPQTGRTEPGGAGGLDAQPPGGDGFDIPAQRPAIRVINCN